MLTFVKKKIWPIVVILLLSLVAFPSLAHADTASPYDKSTKDGVDTFTPYFDDKAITGDTKKIPFTDIYGAGKIPVMYLGEGPWSKCGSNGNDDWVKMRSENRSEDTWGADHNGNPKDHVDPGNIGSLDLHIYAADRADNSLLAVIGRILSKLAAIVIFFFVSIIKFFCGVIINIANLNSSFFLDTIGSDTMVKPMVSVFLGEASAPSGFVIICLLAYLISVTVAIGRTLTGHGGTREIFQEVGILLISCLISSMALFGNIAKVNSSMITAASYISGKISNPEGGDHSTVNDLYTSDTGVPEEDTRRMQLALLERPGIEAYIQAQTGFSSKELNTDDGSSWGVDSGTINSVNKKLGIGVSNQVDGSKPVNNLGYSMYAGNSNVALGQWYSKGVVTQEIPGQSFSKCVDWLQTLVSTSKSEDAKNKAVKIIDSMSSPAYGIMALNGLLLFVMFCCMIPALIILAFLAVMGKIIIAALGFFLPIIALLLLPKNTRSMAKQIIATYVCGFVRYVVGLAGISILLLLTSDMSSRGTAGILVAAVTAILAAKATPQVFAALVSAMGSMGQMSLAQKADDFAMSKMKAAAPGNLMRKGREKLNDMKVGKSKKKSQDWDTDDKKIDSEEDGKGKGEGGTNTEGTGSTENTENTRTTGNETSDGGNGGEGSEGRSNSGDSSNSGTGSTSDDGSNGSKPTSSNNSSHNHDNNINNYVNPNGNGGNGKGAAGAAATAAIAAGAGNKVPNSRGKVMINDGNNNSHDGNRGNSGNNPFSGGNYGRGTGIGGNSGSGNYSNQIPGPRRTAKGEHGSGSQAGKVNTGTSRNTGNVSKPTSTPNKTKTNTNVNNSNSNGGKVDIRARREKKTSAPTSVGGNSGNGSKIPVPKTNSKHGVTSTPNSQPIKSQTPLPPENLHRDHDGNSGRNI